MAREHRGIRLDNGEWAVGSYIDFGERCGKSQHQISFPGEKRQEYYNVKPETVGEFTMIMDLWEDDVIEFRTFDGMGYIGVVKWGEFCYEVETTDDSAPVLYLLDDVIDFNSIVKKGDKWTTPELLND